MGRHIGIVEAGLLASLYWGGITAGRLLAAVGGGVVPVRALLTGAVFAVVVGVGLVWANLSAGCRSRPPARGCRVRPDLSIADCRDAGTSRARARRKRSRFPDRRVRPRPLSRARTRRSGRGQVRMEAIARLILLLALLLAVVYQLLDQTAPAGGAK